MLWTKTNWKLAVFPGCFLTLQRWVLSDGSVKSELDTSLLIGLYQEPIILPPITPPEMLAFDWLRGIQDYKKMYPKMESNWCSSNININFWALHKALRQKFGPFPSTEHYDLLSIVTRKCARAARVSWSAFFIVQYLLFRLVAGVLHTKWIREE